LTGASPPDRLATRNRTRAAKQASPIGANLIWFVAVQWKNYGGDDSPALLDKPLYSPMPDHDPTRTDSVAEINPRHVSRLW
jgi:hypothetical protein